MPQNTTYSHYIYNIPTDRCFQTTFTGYTYAKSFCISLYSNNYIYNKSFIVKQNLWWPGAQCLVVRIGNYLESHDASVSYLL